MEEQVRKKSGRRTVCTPEMKASMVAMREKDGKTVQVIADLHGVCFDVAKHALAGTERPGGLRAGKTPALPPERLVELSERMKASRESAADIWRTCEDVRIAYADYRSFYGTMTYHARNGKERQRAYDRPALRPVDDKGVSFSYIDVKKYAGDAPETSLAYATGSYRGK